MTQVFPNLIGLSGKIGAGKDTAGQILWKTAEYVNLQFARKLKRAVQEIYGFSNWQLQTQEGKAAIDEYWGVSPGSVLQRFGTEAVRDVMGQDVWVKAALRALPERAVFTDVRFPNEADAIRARGGKVIRLTRQTQDLQGRDPNHPSETALDGYEFDAVINNDGTLLQLRNELLSTLVRLGGTP